MQEGVWCNTGWEDGSDTSRISISFSVYLPVYTPSELMQEGCVVQHRRSDISRIFIYIAVSSYLDTRNIPHRRAQHLGPDREVQRALVGRDAHSAHGAEPRGELV